MTATPGQNTQSSSATCLKKPDFRKETRLGLVLYGGVSLAVYRKFGLKPRRFTTAFPDF